MFRRTLLILSVFICSEAFATSVHPVFTFPEDDAVCSISLDEFGTIKIIARTLCNHWYKKESLEEWLDRSNTCPYCQTEVKQSDLIMFKRHQKKGWKKLKLGKKSFLCGCFGFG